MTGILPGPNRMRYNDWRQLNVPTLGRFVPTLPVSVIVPCCNAPEQLARTLAALERQTYPRHLFEVVVVDDGSEPALALPASTSTSGASAGKGPTSAWRRRATQASRQRSTAFWSSSTAT